MRDLLLPAIIEESNFVDSSVRCAQEIAAIRNEEARKTMRLAAYKEWSDPENVRLRLEDFKAKEDEVKARGESMKIMIRELLGLPLEDPPLPDPIPESMRGQSESTIRAMLRQQSWEYDRTLGKWRQL